MKNPIKYFDIFAIFILIILTLGGGLFLKKDFKLKHQTLSYENQLLIKKNNELNTTTKKMTVLKSAYTKSETILNELSDRIPHSPQIGGLLKKLNVLVNKRDLVLKKFNHESPEEIKKLKQIRVNLTLMGDYISIYKFIHDLETLNRIFIIKNLRIQKMKNEKNCNAQITGNVFQQ